MQKKKPSKVDANLEKHQKYVNSTNLYKSKNLKKN